MSSSRKIIVFVIFFLFTSATAVYGQQADGQNEFTSSGRLWGYFFGDIYSKMQGESIAWGTSEFAAEPDDSYGGRLRRLYLGYDYQFTSDLSTRVVVESASNDVLSVDDYDIYFKQAYLTYEFDIGGLHGTELNAGLISSPLFSRPERTWGYRSLEKESLQVRGFGSSVDQGLSFSGHFDSQERHGFTVMLARGAGRFLETDSQFETVGAFHFESLPNVTIELMGQYQQLTDDRTKQALRGFISYESEFAVAGLSFAQGWWGNEPLDNENTLDRKPSVASLFTAFTPFPDLPVLRLTGRFDYYIPHRDFSFEQHQPYPFLHYRESLIIAGFHFAVTQYLDLMPNVYINSYQSRHSQIPDRERNIVPRLTIFNRF